MRILDKGPWDSAARRAIAFRLPGRPGRFPRRLLTAGALATVALGALLLPILHTVPVPVAVPHGPSFTTDASTVATSGSASASRPGAWLKLSPTGGVAPPTGSGVAMAYDPSRAAVVAFGGCDASACPTADTWAYHAGNWTNLSGSLETAPTARSGSSLAYDVHDGKLILFGGRSVTGISAETWTLGATGWTLLAAPGPVPPARADARLTYDPTLAGVVLFGGLGAGGKTLADTWVFSSGTWTDLTTASGAGPVARSDAVFVYDPSDGMDLLFGGSGPCGHPCGDTWSFANRAWTNLTSSLSTAPAARYGAGAAFDPSDNGVLVFGGRGTSGLHDSWTFASGAWQNLSALGIHAVPGHASPAAAYDDADGYIVALGGRSPGASGAMTWAYVLPLHASLLTSATFVGPGTSVELTAFVVGGLPPYRYAIDPGTGTIPSTAPRLVFTYDSPGSYRAVLNVTDSRGVYSLDQVAIHVNVLPLSVTLSISPGTARPGTTVMFTATISGGRAPYAIVWLGLPLNCAASSVPALTCAPRDAGDYRVTVSVTDARNATSVASAGLTVPAPSTAGSTTTAPAVTTASVLPVGWVLVPPLAAGLLLSTLGAVLMWKASRRVPSPPAPRPVCYIPPIWSETPDEYRP